MALKYTGLMESIFEVKLLKIKLKNKTEYHNSDGKPHRNNDLPAVIDSNGYKQWWVNGKHHRNNGPAVIWSDGSKEWWVNGEFIKREKLLDTNYK